MTEITPELIDEFVPTLKGYADCAGTDGFAINAACLMLETIADKLRTGQLILAQPSGDEVEAVAELQLAAFLAGRGSVVSMEHGTRSAKPAPTMDEFRRMARTALDAHRGKQACLKARENSDG